MIRRLHLITGLILFGYLLTHLLNHALGLISLDAPEAGRRVFLLIWRNLPMSVLLYGALNLHMGLAFRSLYRRRRLAMPAWEAAQIILGLAIPPLLVLHVLGTRFAQEFLGVEDSYVYRLLIYFLYAPVLGVKQAAVLLVAWLHACVGLHFWRGARHAPRLSDAAAGRNLTRRDRAWAAWPARAMLWVWRSMIPV